MQGFAEKKKLEDELLNKEKKQEKAVPNSHHLLSISEGPMLLKETKNLEEQARKSYEKSVAIELAAIKNASKLKRKKESRKRKQRKKQKDNQ